MKNRDMRRINKVWDACNPHGQWYTYAQVGVGKNKTIVTLHHGRMTQNDWEYLGKPYFRLGVR